MGKYRQKKQMAMSWYKRASVLTEIHGSYSLSKEELGRIFSSLWLELTHVENYKNNTILCKFKSPKLEGNMLLGTLKELEIYLNEIKGIVKAKAKLFDHTVTIIFDKEVLKRSADLNFSLSQRK